MTKCLGFRPTGRILYTQVGWVEKSNLKLADVAH